MGIESLPLLKSKSQDNTFQRAIDHQYREYKQLNQRAQNLMKKKHITPKDVPSMAKMSATVMTLSLIHIYFFTKFTNVYAMICGRWLI